MAKNRAKNRAASRPWVGAKSLREIFVHVTTPMGLEPFDFIFFFRKNYTKIDLALERVIKNLLKVV